MCLSLPCRHGANGRFRGVLLGLGCLLWWCVGSAVHDVHQDTHGWRCRDGWSPLCPVPQPSTSSVIRPSSSRQGGVGDEMRRRDRAIDRWVHRRVEFEWCQLHVEWEGGGVCRPYSASWLVTSFFMVIARIARMSSLNSPSIWSASRTPNVRMLRALNSDCSFWT